MKNIIDILKAPLRSFVPDRRSNDCKHGFEISDVLDINKDPKCNKCGILLSHLPSA